MGHRAREDYSDTGAAWDSFTHDQARSRAYRWGEDGIAGVSDDHPRLCFALALGNGRDPILKERLFGLTNSEGNHGEDVKELYFYLDSTPTHSYVKYLYKYPQRAYPYADLVHTNRARTRHELEHELIDTGVLDDDRYFDVFVEYAKESPEDLLVRITVANRGPEAATLHLLPTLWFRNTWSWGRFGAVHKAVLRALDPPPGALAIEAWHPELGERVLRLRLRSAEVAGGAPEPFGAAFDETFARRTFEADAFYDFVMPPGLDHEARLIERQALAGMLWSKQYYFLDVDVRLEKHGCHPLRQLPGDFARNREWFHMLNDDVTSRPDKWEYPWYAAWDLAFHCVALSIVDLDFAKQQLNLLLSELYLHPNGQLPAYEWNFGDVNPPVHAWATIHIYRHEVMHTGKGDRASLEHAFHKLLANFTWWVNRKDPRGKNVFEGGFLGLDNIGVFDHSRPLPTEGWLEQADGTAWMALFSQNMLEIALELATANPTTRTWRSSSSSTPSRSRPPWTGSATRKTRCGTRKTASSTTCCACPTAAHSGSRCARWSGCCRSARRPRSG